MLLSWRIVRCFTGRIGNWRHQGDWKFIFDEQTLWVEALVWNWSKMNEIKVNHCAACIGVAWLQVAKAIQCLSWGTQKWIKFADRYSFSAFLLCFLLLTRTSSLPPLHRPWCDDTSVGQSSILFPGGFSAPLMLGVANAGTRGGRYVDTQSISVIRERILKY